MKNGMIKTHVEIRDITRVEEIRAVEELQKQVWGMSDRDIVSVFMMAATNAVGGILLGAYDEDALVGFAYGFVGLEAGQAILHSDMLAVRREYRAKGVGYRLKCAQRERALERNLRLMTWTFDPLQAANAHLNFAKLGVVSARYLVNFYGEQSSSFLHTTGTDRLWLTWPLESLRVKRRIEHGPPVEDVREMERLPALVKVNVDDSPAICDAFDLSEAGRVLIEIPSQIGKVQEQNPACAQAWRAATRRAFTKALDKGFIVKEFFRRETKGVYLLTSQETFENIAAPS